MRSFIPASNEPSAVLAKPTLGWLEHIGECREGQIPRSLLRRKIDTPSACCGVFDSGDMNVISLQVLQKITECTYCLKICDKKSEIDIFIQEYMSHDAGRMVSDTLNSPAGDNPDVYSMALKYYFSHLRAWLVESSNLKKNRTIQNFLMLHERSDLLNEVDAMLDMKVTENWALRNLIKDFFKKILHTMIKLQKRQSE